MSLKGKSGMAYVPSLKKLALIMTSFETSKRQQALKNIDRPYIDENLIQKQLKAPKKGFIPIFDVVLVAH